MRAVHPVRPGRCLEAERQLQPYVDRILTAEQVAMVETHLAECERCRACYSFEEHVRAHLRRVCAEPCPDALKLRLRDLCAECGCDEA